MCLVFYVLSPLHSTSLSLSLSLHHSNSLYVRTKFMFIIFHSNEIQYRSFYIFAAFTKYEGMVFSYYDFLLIVITGS